MAISSQQHYRIYLNDHLALVVAEVELAKRVRRENRQTPLSAFMDDYLEELVDQQQSIEQLLSREGGRESRTKRMAGWLAEKLGRLKFNGSFLHYSDLSRVLELEGLELAAHSRLALWRAVAEQPEGCPAKFGEQTTRRLQQLATHLAEARACLR